MNSELKIQILRALCPTECHFGVLHYMWLHHTVDSGNFSTLVADESAERNFSSPIYAQLTSPPRQLCTLPHILPQIHTLSQINIF